MILFFFYWPLRTFPFRFQSSSLCLVNTRHAQSSITLNNVQCLSFDFDRPRTALSIDSVQTERRRTFVVVLKACNKETAFVLFLRSLFHFNCLLLYWFRVTWLILNQNKVLLYYLYSISMSCITVRQHLLENIVNCHFDRRRSQTKFESYKEKSLWSTSTKSNGKHFLGLFFLFIKFFAWNFRNRMTNETMFVVAIWIQLVR